MKDLAPGPAAAAKAPGTAPPHTAVGHVAAERRMRPVRRFGRHHIDVAVEQQRRSRSIPAQPRHTIAALRGRLQHDRFEALRTQHAGDVVHGGQFIAGRIRRVDAQQRLQMVNGFLRESVPIHVHAGKYTKRAA